MSSFRSSRKLAVHMRDGLRCVYCGAHADHDGVFLTLDHIVPLSLGGTHEDANLVTACHACNSLRGARGVLYLCYRLGVEYEDVRARMRKLTKQRMTRWRRKAVQQIDLLRDRNGQRLSVSQVVTCPWCDTPCDHCLQIQLERRLDGRLWRMA